MARNELVECAELPGRGRSLVTVEPVRAGQILVRESPFLVCVAVEGALACCGICLRVCPAPKLCAGCRCTVFCSSSSCSTSSHGPYLCSALSRVAAAEFDTDTENQVRFLLAAYHISLVSPSSFESLMRLEGQGKADDNVRKLHAFVEDVVRPWPWSSGQEVSIEVTADLLVKEARNAFGHMMPSETPGQRSVRGFAFYSTASLINHDCLPNACRFDYIDEPVDFNTDILVRALHDIPEKLEVTISYFPINWSFQDRQKRLAEEYGFKCACGRCVVEQNWSEDESGDSDGTVSSDSEEGKRGDSFSTSDFVVSTAVNVAEKFGGGEEEEEEEKETGDDFEHAIYFVKYLCPIEGCGGTMAPLPPQSVDTASPESEVGKDMFVAMECNMCGHLRTGDQFREDLQEHGMLV